MRNEIILIPALEPDDKLLKLIHGLQEYGFYRIVIVNDGSSSSYEHIFTSAKEAGCTVCTHNINLGKGAAIKTGILRSIEIYGHNSGIITVDADGQHLPADTARVSNLMTEYPDSLILGTRDFSKGNVPFRSRYGNKLTSLFFRLSTGVKCSDTQTGLRGIPASMLDTALETEGSRYEYEMNFLTKAAKSVRIVSLPIQTIYENNNSGSHFRTIRDSARIYSKPLKFMTVSAISAVIDFSLFYFLAMILALSPEYIIAAATIIARITSGTVNFALNKLWCFKSQSKTRVEAIKYLALFVSQMCLSAGLVTLLSMLINPVIAKVLVDITLFVISYHIQRDLIFNSDSVSPVRKEGKTMRKKRPVWAVSFGLFLTGYTAFALLDAFVIPHDTVKLSEVTTENGVDAGSETNSDNNPKTDQEVSLLDDENQSNTSQDNTSQNDISQNKTRNKPKSFAKNGNPPRRHGKKRHKPSDISNVEASGNDQNENQTDNAVTDDNQANDITNNDTISDDKQTNNNENNTSPTDNSTTVDNSSNADNTSTADYTYSSDNATINITKKYVENTYVYIADIQLKNSSALQSGVADGTLGRNITAKTSEIAADSDAILAINGDYYGFRDSGYVMRNGYLYRETSSGADSEDLVIYSDGTMEIIKEGDITAEELKEKGAVQIYSFGPGLVDNGEINVSENQEVGHSMRSNPRTAIGYYSPTHYCFVVSDGRTSESEGLSLYQLAQVMDELGVEKAYNLDGGGSSTMYFNGEVINKPTTNGNKISERSVSDIIYIKK